MGQLRVGLIGAGGIVGVHIAGWRQLGAKVTVLAFRCSRLMAQQYVVDEVESLEALLPVCG